MKECRAQNVTCNGCGIKGHLKKCCKKSGNFPKDNSNRQNQSSTGSTKMNYASTAPLPQINADFFDEKGVPKEYRPPVQQQQTAGMFVQKKIDPSSSFRSSSRSCSISRFPIPRISAHGSSSTISNRFFQHFRYVRSERKQQFFEKSHQSHRFPLEIRAKQNLTRRNERNRRSRCIRTAYTIFKRFQYYFYFRQFYSKEIYFRDHE